MDLPVPQRGFLNRSVRKDRLSSLCVPLRSVVFKSVWFAEVAQLVVMMAGVQEVSVSHAVIFSGARFAVIGWASFFVPYQAFSVLSLAVVWSRSVALVIHVASCTHKNGSPTRRIA